MNCAECFCKALLSIGVLQTGPIRQCSLGDPKQPARQHLASIQIEHDLLAETILMMMMMTMLTRTHYWKSRLGLHSQAMARLPVEHQQLPLNFGPASAQLACPLPLLSVWPAPHLFEQLLVAHLQRLTGIEL